MVPVQVTFRSTKEVYMRFAYHDLSNDHFEDLIVLVCQRLLGIATQGFATGPDGGRDARFEGTAEMHPSTRDPWVGKVIIQAKHTNGFNKSFSDPDFYNPKTKTNVLAKELPRILNLIDKNSLQHYMLFSNRRLTGNAEEEIRLHLSEKTGIPTSSIFLCGVKNIEDILKRFPELVVAANVDYVDTPLIVTSDEMAEVVEALASHTNDLPALLSRRAEPVARTPYDRKNELNNMTPEYAKAQRRMYLKDNFIISEFLSDPINIELQSAYQVAADEFDLEIIAKSDPSRTMDSVFQYLTRILIDRDPVLARNKRLTRSILFYMYWHCDVGRNDEDATADKALTS